MLKTRIFTAKNVQRYGFTAGEIDELNAEWERKAAGLGLDQHLPEYWQEAKRHMSEKLDGRVAESVEEGGNQPLDGELVELPSLDVNLDDFDIGDENALTAASFSDGEPLVDVVPEELPELELIADELELEGFSAEQATPLADIGDNEPAAVAAADEEPASEPAEAAPESISAEGSSWQGIEREERAEGKEPVTEIAAEELAGEWAAAAQPQTIQGEEGSETQAAAERFVPGEEPELQAEDAAPARKPETAAEEPVPEAAAAVKEGVAPQKESFFGKIISRLQRLFKL